MSQIATLHVVPDGAINDLREAVTPKSPGWFRKPRDVFWETVNGVAPDVLHGDFAGHALLMLVEFLRERFADELAAFEQHALAEHLGNARASYFLVLSPESAADMATKLAALVVTEAELGEFANDFSETDDPDAGRAVLSALECLRRALPKIRPGTIGLLHVG